MRSCRWVRGYCERWHFYQVLLVMVEGEIVAFATGARGAALYDEIQGGDGR